MIKLIKTANTRVKTFNCTGCKKEKESSWFSKSQIKNKKQKCLTCSSQDKSFNDSAYLTHCLSDSDFQQSLKKLTNIVANLCSNKSLITKLEHIQKGEKDTLQENVGKETISFDESLLSEIEYDDKTHIQNESGLIESDLGIFLKESNRIMLQQNPNKDTESIVVEHEINMFEEQYTIVVVKGKKMCEKTQIASSDPEVQIIKCKTQKVSLVGTPVFNKEGCVIGIVKSHFHEDQWEVEPIKKVMHEVESMLEKDVQLEVFKRPTLDELCSNTFMLETSSAQTKDNHQTAFAFKLKVDGKWHCYLMTCFHLVKPLVQNNVDFNLKLVKYHEPNSFNKRKDILQQGSDMSPLYHSEKLDFMIFKCHLNLDEVFIRYDANFASLETLSKKLKDQEEFVSIAQPQCLPNTKINCTLTLAKEHLKSQNRMHWLVNGFSDKGVSGSPLMNKQGVIIGVMNAMVSCGEKSSFEGKRYDIGLKKEQDWPADNLPPHVPAQKFYQYSGWALSMELKPIMDLIEENIRNNFADQERIKVFQWDLK